MAGHWVVHLVAAMETSSVGPWDSERVDLKAAQKDLLMVDWLEWSLVVLLVVGKAASLDSA